MNEQQPLIEIMELSLYDGEKDILKDINFSVLPGQAWAIVGPSGSGKTSLAKVLAGRYKLSSGIVRFNLPSSYSRAFVPQQHDFRDFSSRAYYQQRFDQNYGTESPKVADVLKEVNLNLKDLDETALLLKIDHILSSRLIELSNGEGKRVQLAKVLLQKPDILILDNPFIGLDTTARKVLHSILDHLVDKGIIVFLVTSSKEISQSISHVIELDKGKIKKIYKRNEYLSVSKETPSFSIKPDLLASISFSENESFSIAVKMEDVSVKYNGKLILQEINWTVKRGEKWGLLGPNGSGKSTLLSLINGDNPQAYSNNIILFDLKRGSGESIWDIKNKIGYISPELHLFYQRNPSHAEAVSITSGLDELNGYSQPRTTCFEAIASGFNDQIGSSQRITSLQIKQVYYWMNLLGINHLKDEPFCKVSLGEQRIVLLARAMVKNPALLILDEPCQGLDDDQIQNFIQITDEVCAYFNKTLIYVSHYKNDIPKSIHKFLMLEKGMIKEIISAN